MLGTQNESDVNPSAVVQEGAIVEEGAKISANCFIGYYSIVRPKVFIGCYSEVRSHCFIAEGAQIGSDVKIFQFSNIGAGSILERRVYIGPRVLLTNTRKISHGRTYSPRIEPPILRFGCRIGGGSVLLPGVEIGMNSVIGAGSVVTHSIPSNVVAVGNPAKIIKEIDAEEILDEGTISFEDRLRKCRLSFCPKLALCWSFCDSCGQ